MFRSIRWRIAAAFAVLLVVCIGGLSAYLSHFFRDNYMSNLRMQLADQAKLVGDASEPYFLGGDTDNLDALAKRLGGQIDARVTIVDSDGSVLGDSKEDPAEMENHGDRPEVIEALAGGTGSDVRRSETLYRDMMYVAAVIAPEGDAVGVARVALPLTDINSAMGHINAVIAVGALVAAALGILLAFLITRITVDPIRRLTMISQDMAEGNLSQEITVPSRDEVGDLGRAFNRMAVKLKEAMALVTAERDRMAIVLESMGDAIFVLDGKGRVTMTNKSAEKVLQVPRDAATGRHFIEVVRDHEIDALLQQCLKTRTQQTGVVELRSKKQLLGIIATPFQEDSGCLLLIQDLTELRKLETVRRDFIANLSHELRTPIASLKALGETLHEGAIEQRAVARDFVGKMNVEVDRLAQMVQEMGELSRIESGEAPLQKTPVNAAEVVDRAAGRLKAQADRAGLRLEIQVAQNLPRVPADEARLEQVLVNLIHNAIKFTPSGGRITVSAKAEGGKLVVSVSDTGVGIPEDDLPRVFERFYKADRARAGGGTGLGLAIAKHVVEAHGGRIWVECVEGRGATFSFSMPLAS
ncbi:MAG: cell wall metabolism sensor histidine kinase WalK [Methanomicrobiales archaeon]|nr:cell wall metabolism sensor histidine kinase WalK [Methanomicrobiales archaeon]